MERQSGAAARFFRNGRQRRELIYGAREGIYGAPTGEHEIRWCVAKGPLVYGNGVAVAGAVYSERSVGVW